jgi:hypothetical protein
MRSIWPAGTLTALFIVSVCRAQPPAPPNPTSTFTPATAPAPAGAPGTTGVKPLYAAQVIVPEAFVRCLPSDSPQAYATNRLVRGSVVKVLGDAGVGWLAILPPEGSFSWINTRFVERVAPNYPNWVVQSQAPAPVLIGSEILKGKPNKEGVRLPRGYQVRCVGKTQTDEDGTWLPIEPPVGENGEKRYIRRDDVSPSTGAGAVAGGAGSIPAARPGGMPTAGSAPTAAAAPSSEVERIQALYSRAQQADRSGNIAEAIQLYEQVGTEGGKFNHPLAMQALNRAYWLRHPGGPQRSVGVSVRPASEVRYTGAPAVNVNVQAGPATQAPTQLASNQRPATTWSPNPLNNNGYYSSGPGYLRRSGRSLDGRPTYTLDSPQGLPLFYVTPGSGQSLEAYVGQHVELQGPAIYRGDIRANYMIAERVVPVP